MWRRHLLRCASDHLCLVKSSPSSSKRVLSCAVFASCRNVTSWKALPWNGGQASRKVSWILQARFKHMDSITQRGVFEEKAYQHVKGSDVKGFELVSDGRILSVTWSDGTVSRFHSVWLRVTCFCPQCRIESTGQCNVPFDTTSQSRLTSANVCDDGTLEVSWKECPGHTGVFPLKFLKANCYSTQALEHRRRSVAMTFTKDTKVIPRFPYKDVMTSDSDLYKWVRALNETGVTIVSDVPCEAGMVVKVCQRIAHIVQHTVYGEIFDVKVDARPVNAAYSSGELKPHMDQPHYEGIPGIQALHCIKFDEKIKGGENTFVDLFHAAETFRKDNPEDFELLRKVPVSFETIHYKRDWPVHLRYARHTFTTNKDGDLIGVVWHPQLFGTQRFEEDLVEPVFEALGRFYTLVNNFSFVYRYRLKPGELVAFNNRRMVHGRDAFTQEGGERWLQGTYVEISEFKSCVHVLSNLHGDGRLPIRVGDFDQ